MTHQHDPFDRRAGSLITQALGDALGFLVEGYGPDICTQYVEHVFSFDSPPDLVRGGFTFGQYSDDTQLARELALSLGNANDYAAKDFGTRVAKMFADNLIVGRGSATEAAAHKLIAGVPWDEAGTPSPNAGNGAAMRAAPVGWLMGDEADMIRIANDTARVTHADFRSRAAAILVALVVRDAISNGPLDDSATLAHWADILARYDTVLASAVKNMRIWLPQDPHIVSREITEWCVPPEGSSHKFEKWEGISPFATPSALYALYAYARAPKDPEEVLKVAIAVGGDVDTVAAMAGAMVGAAVGLTELTPRLKRWAQFLNDQGTYKYDELVMIARGVW